MTEEEAKNFPQPKGAADRIALKGAELLDRDVFDKIGRQNDDGTTVTIYGVRFHNVGRDTLSVATQTAIEGPWDVVGKEPVSKPCAVVFNQSFDGAMRRQRERDLERVEAGMVPPLKVTPPPVIRRKSFFERIFGGLE